MDDEEHNLNEDEVEVDVRELTEDLDPQAEALHDALNMVQAAATRTVALLIPNSREYDYS